MGRKRAVAADLPNVSLVIVDDNPGSLELLSKALEQPDLEISTATDPEEGLDLIFQEHAHIVLTDVVIPKMSGLELLERIVNFDPAIEVLLMTAHYSTESAVEAIRKGASDYLNKRVSVSALRGRSVFRMNCAAAPNSSACSPSHILLQSIAAREHQHYNRAGKIFAYQCGGND